MRITNKIMSNNALSNINQNKLLQDKLNTQMINHKKIDRPSEDPVIAIRALRLRSTLSQVTQYCERNVKDARAWLDVTDTALQSVYDTLSKMRENCQKGTRDSFEPSDREKVLESLKGFRKEVYATGDADYSDRTVFTGYRTGTKLTFQSDTSQKFTLTEQLDRDVIDQVTYVKAYNGTDALEDLNTQNYDTMTTTEQTVEAVDVYRIRLAYEELDSPANVTIEYGFTRAADGTLTPAQTLTPTREVNSYDLPDPYTTLGDDDVVLVRDTGELLLGKNVYAELAEVRDNYTTQDVNEGEIRITYDKSEWKQGDPNPVHYFACTSTPPGELNPIHYNEDYLNNVRASQPIEYDVGYNQTIQINTTADEVYCHDMGRDVDEMIRALEDVIEMEGIRDDMKALVDKDPNDAAAARQLAAAEKALTLMTEKMRKLFGACETRFSGYIDRTNQASAECGTRGARLDLIEKRLQAQMTTFDALASENENADMTIVAVELEEAQYSYDAALRATAQIVQNSLISFL